MEGRISFTKVQLLCVYFQDLLVQEASGFKDKHSLNNIQ